MRVTIFEKRKITAYSNRGRAMQEYKDKWALSLDDEDRINCRRIYETLRDTETQKIRDSYEKENYILSVIKRSKDEKWKKAFRLGSNEVLIITKEYKGAGGWYSFVLVDGVTDDNNIFLTDETHLIASLQNVYQNNLEGSLHKMIFWVVDENK